MKRMGMEKKNREMLERYGKVMVRKGGREGKK